MNKNRYFLTLFAVTILAGLVALGACQSTEDVQPLALVPVAGVGADFDFEQAAENKAYRWIEMAKAYERNGLLNKETNPDEVLAFHILSSTCSAFTFASSPPSRTAKLFTTPPP